MEANSNTVESGAQGLGKILLEVSRLDHILALFVSGKGDLGVDRLGCRFGENSQLLMVLTTSLAILVACVLFLVWRRGGSALSKPLEKPIPLVKENEEDDSGKKKVTCFLWDSDRDSGRIFQGCSHGEDMNLPRRVLLKEIGEARISMCASVISEPSVQEYGLGGCVTTKGDVYSYGVVLLEMLTRKKPTDNMFVEGVNLQKWVGSSVPKRVGDVVDRSLLRRTSTITEDDKELNCLSHLVSVGLLCTKNSPKERPTMIDIVGQLQNIKDIFLDVVGVPKFQSDITLLGSASNTHNNTCESQDSSTS